MGYVGQVLVNRTRINKSSLITELSKPRQYPTTWSKIKNGSVTPKKETVDLAKKLLSGEKNGFENSPVAKKDLNLVYFQSKSKLGTTLFWSGWHYYGK